MSDRPPMPPMKNGREWTVWKKARMRNGAMRRKQDLPFVIMPPAEEWRGINKSVSIALDP